MAHKQAQEELRSACRLYGPVGMWDAVVRETAAARVRQKEALEAQAAHRDRVFYILSVVVGVVLFVAGTALLIWGADRWANG